MNEGPPGRRRQARERAIGFLYEAETKDAHPAEVIADVPVRPDEFAVRLAEGTGDHQHQIDHLLDEVARPRWSVARMAAMDRAVLRLGVYELRYEVDVPTGVILSEAVDLATRYSTDDSPKFVNGVLGQAATLVRDDGRWPAPDVLLLDCDGLFRHWRAEPIHQREEELGLSRGALFHEGFEEDLFRRATLGEITSEEWGFEIARRVEPEADAGRLAVIATAWTMGNWELDEDFVALARRVADAGRVRLTMFSNATTKLEEDLEEMGLADLLEVVVNSARLGMAKPDPAAFKAAAQLVDAEPGRILFIDDRTENVEGALEAGLQAAHHGGQVSRCEAVLVRYGILDAEDPAS